MNTNYTERFKKTTLTIALSATVVLAGAGTSFAQSPVSSSSVFSGRGVQMLSFGGEIKENKGLLIWTTENETSARYFVIERSATGSGFDSIGVVAAMNNTYAYNYRFTDKDLLKGKNYYRLRHVNNDGNISFTKVVILSNFNTAASGKMSVFPNPAGALVNYAITGNTGSQVTVQVYNLSGVLIMAKQQLIDAGVNQQSISVAALKNGNYFLKVSNTQGTVQYTQAFSKI
jgi:hypothetical protein